MRVDPIKPTLKAPGTKRLKLEYDDLLSSVAFNFNLRRYRVVDRPPLTATAAAWTGPVTLIGDACHPAGA